MLHLHTLLSLYFFFLATILAAQEGKSYQPERDNAKERVEMARTLVRKQNTAENRTTLANELNSLGWYELLLGNFVQAEKHIRESMATDQNNVYPNTNLPPVLLFQGKATEARRLYKQWMAKPFTPDLVKYPTFRDVYLSDFEQFRDLGLITQKNTESVESIRRMLMDMPPRMDSYVPREFLPEEMEFTKMPVEDVISDEPVEGDVARPIMDVSPPVTTAPAPIKTGYTDGGMPDCPQRCLLLDGQDDFLHFSGQQPINGIMDWSVECAFMLPTGTPVAIEPGSYNTIVPCGDFERVVSFFNAKDGLRLEIGHCSGKLFLYAYGMETYDLRNLQSAAQPGRWQQLVVTFAENQLSVYHNAQLVFTGTERNLGISDTRFGSWVGNNGYFQGFLDDIKIWNKARTAEEIRVGKPATAAEQKKHLLHHYTFEEGTAWADNTHIKAPTNSAQSGAQMQFSELRTGWKRTGEYSNYACIAAMPKTGATSPMPVSEPLNFQFPESPGTKRQVDISGGTETPIIAVEGFGDAHLQYFQADGKRIGKVNFPADTDGEISALKWSHDGHYLAVQGHKTDKIRVYDRMGNLVQTWDTYLQDSNPRFNLGTEPAELFDWNGTRLITCRKSDGMLRYWQIDQEKPVMELQEGILRSWNWNMVKPMQEVRLELPRIPANVRCFDLSPDGFYVLTGHKNGDVVVTPITSNLPKGQQVWHAFTTGSSVVDVEYSPLGNTIIAAPYVGGNIWLQRLDEATPATTFVYTQSGNSGIRFTPDGKYLLSAGTDWHPREAKMVDLQGKEVRRFPLAADMGSNVAISPDGRWAIYTLFSTMQLVALDPQLTLMGSLAPTQPVPFASIPQDAIAPYVNEDDKVMAMPEPEIAEITDAQMLEVQRQAVQRARETYKQQNTTETRKQLSQELNSLGWYALLNSDFVGAERACREALVVDPTNLYPATNIPAALLLQGKYKEAARWYTNYKSKPFPPGGTRLPTYREAFLDDLNTFEQKGLIKGKKVLKDVKKVRKLLAE
jgi:WD40 repeat protein/Flp pilus assembly protein TadD